MLLSRIQKFSVDHLTTWEVFEATAYNRVQSVLTTALSGL
ncbi:hypothetical protein KNP414_00024 [Paenibacillus mucilaginosus KNP414]|uniref:Uncharacterized protein n=1 Tax=Paenibacillus mucilaginosus (strain KNP414) TaxID=1036673 RepID=F8FH26_PAEMK|nr:hypothetical protein KNP414_00024 [Paenibacillus mucilaginosus KNP414]